MAGLLSGVGSGNAEPHALAMGVIAIVATVIFFLERFNVIRLKFNISDPTYLMFFAIFTLLSGIVHLLSTLGVIGTK